MTNSNKGLVFSIKRFALHDGSGLRTTIFFKGCNLKCGWCHNPEGLKLSKDISLINSKCIDCNFCNDIDTHNVIVKRGQNRSILNKPNIDYDEYINVCPTGAIKYDSKYYTIMELVDEVMKDEVFFKQGGGITLSGGEALLQIDFVTELLKTFKTLNINTAIETALNVPTYYLDLVVPYLDHIYVDLKEMDDNKHKAFTNVSNNQIIKNIKYLLTSSQAEKVIVRTPLIPNHTANEENIRKISQYITSIYPQVKYELLNYNPLGISKYEQLEMVYSVDPTLRAYNENEMIDFKQIAITNGVINII